MRGKFYTFVFCLLFPETQSFVALLFKTIENKEYLNVKKDGMKEDKKLDDTKLVNTLNKPTDTSGKDSEKTDVKENDDQNISSTDEKQNGVQIQSSVVSEGTVLKASEAEVKPGDGRDERKKENVRYLKMACKGFTFYGTICVYFDCYFRREMIEIDSIEIEIEQKIL